MCEVKIKSLLKALAGNDTKKRVEDVNEFLESFKNEQNALDIITYLLKNIGSARKDRKDLIQSFQLILGSMNQETLELTLSKMKEQLFLNKIKDATKGQLSNHKLSSILTFDALLNTIEISQIDNNSLTYFFEYILSLIDDNMLGFIATLTIMNFFTKTSKDNKSYLGKLKDDFLKLENLVDNPQYLLFWLNFSDEQRKTLKSLSKTVPSIQSKDVLNKLPDALKSCGNEQLRTLLSYILANSSFTVVWKHLYGSISEGANHSKLKQILLTAFELVLPIKGGIISQMTNEKRISLIKKIWGNEIVLNLILKQLSGTSLDLHVLCQKFVLDLTKADDDNESIMEELLKTILVFGKKVVEREAEINQTLRLSIALLRYVKSKEVFNNYIDIVGNYFDSAEKCHQKIYAIEQLSGAFVKCQARDEKVVDKLLRINYDYNYVQLNKEVGLTDSAQFALLRCLETFGNDNLDKLKTLLTMSSIIYVNEDLGNVCKEILKFWSDTVVKSKKRRASQQNQVAIDLTNKTNGMFISLLAHLCFYICSQPFDEETMEMIDDINTCFNKFRGISDDTIPAKRSKTDEKKDESKSEEKWTIVFADLLTVLLEQNCHYLRTLAVNAFKSLVTEGLCDRSVIDHVNTIIERTETETNNVHRKGGEDVDKMDEDEQDKEEEAESDVSDSEDDEVEEMEVDKESDLKARIFAALGSVNADVHSDSDDNCPVIEEQDSSDEDETGEMSMNKPKVTLKEKRRTVLQLRQFRNRCIDLLETVVINAPKLEDRLVAFLILLGRIKKSDQDIESRLVRSTNVFKKYQPKEEISVDEIIHHIKQLVEGIQKCTITKNVIQIFSSMIVTFLRMKKEEMSTIVDSLKPMIEQCITDKKKHTLKAIFWGAFENFPEISWAFHKQILPYINSDQAENVQFQAIGVLRKTITNQGIRSIVLSGATDSFVSKSEILSFVNTFGEAIRSLFMNVDVAKHAKHSAHIIGSLIDCLKLGGHTFYQTLDANLLEKINGIPKASLPKDLVKTLNQFRSAVDCAKKSVKEI